MTYEGMKKKIWYMISLINLKKNAFIVKITCRSFNYNTIITLKVNRSILGITFFMIKLNFGLE